jgi:hypothetical protein
MTFAGGGNTNAVKWSRPIRKPLLAAAIAVPAVAAAAVGAHATLTSPHGAPAASTDTATPAATSDGQSQDAHAIVVNHGDDRSRYALTLKITQVSGDVVDPQNAAVAVAANCNDCETVAISLEGVLVYGDPTVFAPENIALAYNEDCTNCATLAAAYQEVVQHSDRVRITGEGRRQIAAIRVDLESIRQENLSLQEIDDRVNADAGVLLQVLRDDVVPVGNPSSSSPTATTSSTAPSSAAPAASSDTSSSPASPDSSTTGSSAPATTASGSPSSS